MGGGGGGGWHSRIESLQVLLTFVFGLGLWQYFHVRCHKLSNKNCWSSEMWSLCWGQWDDMMMGTKPKISLVTIISQDAAPHKLMLMRTPQEILNIRIGWDKEERCIFLGATCQSSSSICNIHMNTPQLTALLIQIWFEIWSSCLKCLWLLQAICGLASSEY